MKSAVAPGRIVESLVWRSLAAARGPRQQRRDPLIEEHQVDRYDPLRVSHSLASQLRTVVLQLAMGWRPQ